MLGARPDTVQNAGPSSPLRRTLVKVGQRLTAHVPARLRDAPVVKASKIVRDYVGGVYYPLLGVNRRQRLAITPRLLLVEYLVYRVDKITERSAAEDLDVTRTSDYDKLHQYKARVERLIRGLGGWNSTVAKLLDDGEEFVRRENALTSGHQVDEAGLLRLVELRPTDVRILHAMAEEMLNRPSNPTTHAVAWTVETLADIANDLDHYYADAAAGRLNVYASYLHLYGADEGPLRLQAQIDAYGRDLQENIQLLPVDQQQLAQRCCERLLGARLDQHPDPSAPPGEAKPEPAAVSTTVIIAGTICVLAWIVAYASIIYRGFADQTFGMPITALAANLSWEFLYGFVLDPLGDYIHLWSIPCFLVDLVILWQAWRFGADDFTDPAVSGNFHRILAGAIAAAVPITYRGFVEFDDPDGEYTGFGINLMMSTLFLAMLSRRGSAHGQSMYAAIAKWIGTLMAWVATALTVTTTPERPLPRSLATFARISATHTTYPLTPMINLMYWATFIIDGIYTHQLYRRLRADGVDPWRRF